LCLAGESALKQAKAPSVSGYLSGPATYTAASRVGLLPSSPWVVLSGYAPVGSVEVDCVGLCAMGDLGNLAMVARCERTAHAGSSPE
jgi:hypothetical protein